MSTWIIITTAKIAVLPWWLSDAEQICSSADAPNSRQISNDTYCHREDQSLHSMEWWNLLTWLVAVSPGRFFSDDCDSESLLARTLFSKCMPATLFSLTSHSRSDHRHEVHAASIWALCQHNLANSGNTVIFGSFAFSWRKAESDWPTSTKTRWLDGLRKKKRRKEEG